MVLKNPVYKNKNNVTIKNIGGIVTSKNPAFLDTDRLSDGYNIWNKNGFISTRPGLSATENGIIEQNIKSENVKLYYSDLPFENIDGYNNFCALINDLNYRGTKIKFFAADTLGIVHHIASLDLIGYNGAVKYDVKNLLFIKSKAIRGSGIFIILPVHITDGETLEEKKEVLYYEFSTDYKDLLKADPDEFYRPIIIRNGYGNLVTSETRQKYTETRPEGVSLINGLFEARFVIDNSSYIFNVPTSFAEDALIEICYYSSDLGRNFAYIQPGEFISNTFEYRGKEIYFTVNRSYGKIYVRCDSDNHILPKNTDIESLRIYSRADVGNAAYEIFSSNAKPVLFDSRLFIPGGNKVYYSSKTEHLYFCEDYSISVGNKSYDITALSMQSKYIIAFKERALYRLSVDCSDEIVIEKMQADNNEIIYKKPKCRVTQINDTIGCDLPNTIVTCANRLVWFHSDGIVYTLYGSNLYTEGSIYELSSDISNLLTDIKKEHLRNAFATDLNGYYVLGIYNRLFLLNVRVSGFRYLSGQSSKKGTNLGWFLWGAPENTSYFSAFLSAGKEFFILYSKDLETLYIAKLSGEKDIFLSSKENKEKLPEFSLSTAVFGEDFHNINRVSLNAFLKHPATFTLFDENGDFDNYNTDKGNRFKSYIIPASYKKGGFGIKIKGSGEFNLKDIVCSFNERIY